MLARQVTLSLPIIFPRASLGPLADKICSSNSSLRQLYSAVIFLTDAVSLHLMRCCSPRPCAIAHFAHEQQLGPPMRLRRTPPACTGPSSPMRHRSPRRPCLCAAALCHSLSPSLSPSLMQHLCSSPPHHSHSPSRLLAISRSLSL